MYLIYSDDIIVYVKIIIAINTECIVYQCRIVNRSIAIFGRIVYGIATYFFK